MRRYSSKELSEILKLANEMKDSSEGSSGEGFTLAQVQAVAGKVGMDPATIAAAAAKFDLVRQGADSQQPNQYGFRREIPYVVSDTGWERMIDELRMHTSSTGTVRERADGSREWTYIEGGDSYIAALSDDGVTSRFDLSLNRSVLAVMGKVGICVFLLFSALIGTAIASKGGFTVTDFVVLACVLMAELVGYFAARSTVRRGTQKSLAGLVGKIEAAAIPQAQSRLESLSERPGLEGDEVHSDA